MTVAGRVPGGTGCYACGTESASRPVGYSPSRNTGNPAGYTRLTAERGCATLKHRGPAASCIKAVLAYGQQWTLAARHSCESTVPFCPVTVFIICLSATLSSSRRKKRGRFAKCSPVQTRFAPLAAASALALVLRLPAG